LGFLVFLPREARLATSSFLTLLKIGIKGLSFPRSLLLLFIIHQKSSQLCFIHQLIPINLLLYHHITQQHSSHVKMQYSIVTLVAFIASAFAAPTASTGWSIKGFTRSLSHFHRHFPSFPTSSPPHPSISADSRIPSDCRQTYVCRYNFTIETGSDSQQCTVEDGDKEVETHTFSALSCEEVSHSATLPTFHLSIFFSALPSNFLDAEKLLTQHRRTDLKLPGAGTKRTTSPSSLSSMCQPKPRLSSATTTPMPDFLLPATRTLVLTKFNTLSDSLSDLFRRQH
jgi:hypothetical protein